MLKLVTRALERVAPFRLAEKWDNVGVLLEAPYPRSNATRVLLTIDLTPAVLEEALGTPTSVIVAYHPSIFKPLSSLTLATPLQRSLLKCAAAGISVISPHTSLDSVRGGINDWLAECFTSLEPGLVESLNPESADEIGAGLGRVVKFTKPVNVDRIIPAVKAFLGLNYVQFGSAKHIRPDANLVRTIAICAGSGGAVFKGVQADLYFTGEMQHHEVLAAVGQGINVLLCGHDNTERGYLTILREKLKDKLLLEKDNFDGNNIEVEVSKQDRHPLEVL
ncbi:hypothetical protein Clacol_007385 [Clathrus columnatus]|uniref:NIF3-like protein 1 n=1 Tax=Clathrus columnatus TaxID=1419009 RepID=A0AAV5AMI4_9AGAM|nr:hypothetical protein Clacol_007385 [Clathrus columnatus]